MQFINWFLFSENTDFDQKFTPAILNLMSKRLKSLGYDTKGGQDVKNTLQSNRIYRNNEFYQDDWKAAYEAAVESVEKTKTNLQNKKLLTPNVNREVVRSLGTTLNPKEAGYIRPDGHLVDLSAGGSGMRGDDHRIVGGVAGMQELMAHDGYVRYIPEGGGFELRKSPTKAQISQIKRLCDYHQGEVILDLYDGLGSFNDRDNYYRDGRRWNFEFRKGTNPYRIITAIQQFFSGETPITTSRD